jgi:hypothetical protein
VSPGISDEQAFACGGHRPEIKPIKGSSDTHLAVIHDAEGDLRRADVLGFGVRKRFRRRRVAGVVGCMTVQALGLRYPEIRVMAGLAGATVIKGTMGLGGILVIGKMTATLLTATVPGTQGVVGGRMAGRAMIAVDRGQIVAVANAAVDEDSERPAPPASRCWSKIITGPLAKVAVWPMLAWASDRLPWQSVQ